MKDDNAHLRAPADFRMDFAGVHRVRIFATITTLQEAEAMREIILLISKTLTSHREMVRADIHGPPPPRPCFSARLEAMFGTAQGTSAGTAETHSGSGRQPAGPTPQGDAPDTMDATLKATPPQGDAR